MSYNGPTETNYFIEIHPGDALSSSINEQKQKLRGVPNSQYVGDDPHFTMIAARTASMHSLINATQEVANRLSKFTYGIIGLEEIQYPNGPIEIRTVVHPEDRGKFKSVHLAIVEASRPYRTRESMDRYNPSVMSDVQKENLEYCGFPNARDLFAPHASLGRFAPNTIEQVRSLIEGYNPAGLYEAYKMIIWRLSTVAEDPTETPEKLEDFLFAI